MAKYESFNQPGFTSRTGSFALLALLVGVAGHARAESLDMPMARPSTNAAIHYQRAMLYLGSVDPVKRELLSKPIWEILAHDTTDADLAAADQLLIESRFAVRSALTGARQSSADFGLDLRQYLVAAYLPHVDPMTQLGRLVALHGMQRQAAGDWAGAVKNYLAILRMGRHMAAQATLAEALAGVELLETGYYALANWATRCPDAALVDETFHIVNGMARDMVNPARTLRSEAAISKMRLEAFADAFPDGAWAEMVLETLGDEVPHHRPEKMKEAAIAAAEKAGVPKAAFESKESFTEYMGKLRSVYVTLAKESANVLNQPAPMSIEMGQALFARYEAKLLPTERASTLNTGKTASYFAVHEAELNLLRLILAVAAEQSSDGYPADLSVVADRFGGSLPTSPFDGGEIRYETLEGGKGFSLVVAAAKVGDIDLPKIEFRFAPEESGE